MKKLFTLGLVLTLSLAFTIAVFAVSPADVGRGTVGNCTWLNVRSTGGMGNNIVGVLPAGMFVTVHERGPGPAGRHWYRITADNGLSGWVFNRYLLAGEVAVSAPSGGGSGAPAVGNFTPVNASVVTTIVGLNVRSFAGMGDNIVGGLAPGSQIRLINVSAGQSNNRHWYQMEFTRPNGTILRGWVYNRYVTIN